MELVKKIKLTYQYYKSLGKKKKPQSSSDLNIRSDVYAFLTCPEPVITIIDFKSKHIILEI